MLGALLLSECTHIRVVSMNSLTHTHTHVYDSFHSTYPRTQHRYNGREAQKDLRQEILEWRGASQDSLPSLYLRLVRWFEATGNTRWSKDQLVRLLNMLGLRNNVNRKFTSLRVSQICEILSLALAFPSYVLFLSLCICVFLSMITLYLLCHTQPTHYSRKQIGTHTRFK